MVLFYGKAEGRRGGAVTGWGWKILTVQRRSGEKHRNIVGLVCTVATGAVGGMPFSTYNKASIFFYL